MNKHLEVTMNKLDMNLFAFVAWLGRNQHVHSEDGLTINDGYEWYNYMWNMWLKNSDIGRKISNGEITTMGGNNNPDTNTSTTGNILNTWRSHGVNITGNTSDNMWTKTLTNDRNLFENDLWNKTVNWDKNNNVNRVTDEEKTPYNVKTNVVTSGKTDDGTITTIEITIDIKQR
jgi:hypothetical protein